MRHRTESIDLSATLLVCRTRCMSISIFLYVFLNVLRRKLLASRYLQQNAVKTKDGESLNG